MKTENIFLTLGLIFSIILIKFQIGNGFEFINIDLNFSFADIALNKSNETYLNSTVIGYFCYFIFSLIIWKKLNSGVKMLILIFSILTFVGIGIELKAFYENFNGVYNGAHFRIGIPLALIGFFITNKVNKKEINVINSWQQRV